MSFWILAIYIKEKDCVKTNWAATFQSGVLIPFILGADSAPPPSNSYSQHPPLLGLMKTLADLTDRLVPFVILSD